MLRFWFHMLPSQDGKRRRESPRQIGQSTRGKVTQEGSNLNQKSLFFYQLYQRESIQSYCELCGFFDPTALSTFAPRRTQTRNSKKWFQVYIYMLNCIQKVVHLGMLNPWWYYLLNHSNPASWSEYSLLPRIATRDPGMWYPITWKSPLHSLSGKQMMLKAQLCPPADRGSGTWPLNMETTLMIMESFCGATVHQWVLSVHLGVLSCSTTLATFWRIFPLTQPAFWSTPTGPASKREGRGWGIIGRSNK